MYSIVIIPEAIALKMKSTTFDGCQILDPVMGNINGIDVYFLQASLKEEKVFAKVLADFEVCELKDIETIAPASFDSKGLITTDPTKIVTTKTVLTETIIKEIEPIKIITK